MQTESNGVAQNAHAPAKTSQPWFKRGGWMIAVLAAAVLLVAGVVKHDSTPIEPLAFGEASAAAAGPAASQTDLADVRRQADALPTEPVSLSEACNAAFTEAVQERKIDGWTEAALLSTIDHCTRAEWFSAAQHYPRAIGFETIQSFNELQQVLDGFCKETDGPACH